MILEVLILVSLLVVIVLLLQDKIILLKTWQHNKDAMPEMPRLPDIMGLPRNIPRQELPNNSGERQHVIPGGDAATFDMDSDMNYFGGVVPQEELDEIFGPEVDFDEEEAEWRLNVSPEGQDGLATGVTFEELSIMGSLLRKESMDTDQEEQFAWIAHRMQGTDLYDQMVGSIENASERIAGLLDKYLAPEMDSGSSTMRNDNASNFDITNFV